MFYVVTNANIPKFNVKVKNTQLFFSTILFYCLKIMDFADYPLYLHY